jgi:hypothetical protein
MIVIRPAGDHGLEQGNKAECRRHVGCYGRDRRLDRPLIRAGIGVTCPVICPAVAFAGTGGRGR